MQVSSHCSKDIADNRSSCFSFPEIISRNRIGGLVILYF